MTKVFVRACRFSGPMLSPSSTCATHPTSASYSTHAPMCATNSVCMHVSSRSALAVTQQMPEALAAVARSSAGSAG